MKVDAEISLPLEELRGNCVEALCERGAERQEAETIFADYMDAELRGRASHGFASFGVALDSFPKLGDAEVTQHSPGVIKIAGNGDCAHTVLRDGIDAALPHLAEQRAYVIGVTEVTRVNTPGVIARYGAERDAIALVLEYGGKNLMAAPGAVQPSLSTNPLALGIPSTSPLFVLDIATSERALGYVALAKLAGAEIPPAWAIDERGEPTIDPGQVYALRPFAAHKGFGLALAIELLAGVLTGTPVGARGTLDNRGVFILLLSPTVFGLSQGQFAAAAQEFLDEVVDSGAEGGHSVRYPGMASADRWNQAMATQSVTLPASVWKELKQALGGQK